MRMHQYFRIDMSGALFLRNVLVFSLASLMPILLLYIFWSAGFAAALAQGGPALQRFLRQVLTNGLPVVFVVNYVGFFLFALSQKDPRSRRDPAIFVLFDVGTRVVLFFLLHVFIYVLSADWFGSFGGSRATALKVVAPTLARSALFENISGVYLYATLVSALPLYVAVARQSSVLRPFVGLFPNGVGPAVVALLCFMLVMICLTAGAHLVVRLQG